MDLDVATVLVITGLLLVTVLVSALAERLGAPPPSLLVIAGFGLGLLPFMPGVHVSPTVIVLLVIPPLLFAAAEQVRIPELRSLWRPIAVLALGLVVVTAVAVAYVVHGVESSVPLDAAFVLGAVLASTDPVAVTALSRRLPLPPRVATLVQGESLFNDATSLVLFEVAATAVVVGTTSIGDGVWRFVVLGGGGVVIGVVVGTLAGIVLRRLHHRPTAQTLAVLVAPYAAALVAWAVDVSTVTAVIVAGLGVARRGRTRADGAGRVMAERAYERLVALVENAVFALIGLSLATYVDELPHADRTTAALLVGVVTVALLAVRGLALATGLLVARRPRELWRTAAVVTWAGARGVIPLAAALSIPETTDAGGPFPDRPLLLVVAIGATVISLVVQGTTLALLVRRLGLGLGAGGADGKIRS